MHECLKFGRWSRYCAGDVIVHPWTSRIKLHLIIEGLVELDDTCEVSTKHSGTIFDFGVANIFGVYLGFDCSDEKGFTARAKVWLLFGHRCIARFLAAYSKLLFLQIAYLFQHKEVLYSPRTTTMLTD